MKIVMTLLVRDEDDIIGENLEYHLKNGVDFFIIKDHRSTDNTLSIIKEYEARGLAKVLIETSEEHHQALWVSEMAKSAFTDYGADWVINNDADEFWVAKNGTLKDFFKSFDSSFFNVIEENVCKIHVNRYDFFYRPFKHGKFFEAMLFRESSRRWTKCCHRAIDDIEVGVGNHDVQSKTFDAHNSKTLATTDIKVFHYPIRTVDRYKAKILNGAIAVLNTPGIPSELFFHWKSALQCIYENRFDDYLKDYARDVDQINNGIRDGSIVFDDTMQKAFLTSTL